VRAISVLLLLCVSGCAADVAVSGATRDTSRNLMLIGEDLQRDSDNYLREFRTSALEDLAAAERVTRDTLTTEGVLTPANEATVAEAFRARRLDLETRISSIRAQHRQRIEALQASAATLLAIDRYYGSRNYKVWEAMGIGAAQGVISKASQLGSLVTGTGGQP